MKVGTSIGDLVTGLYAAQGILAALVERERTGRGARVEVAMLDSLASPLPTASRRRTPTCPRLEASLKAIELSYGCRRNRIAKRIRERVHRPPARAMRGGDGLEIEFAQGGYRFGNDAFVAAGEMKASEDGVHCLLRETFAGMHHHVDDPGV